LPVWACYNAPMSTNEPTPSELINLRQHHMAQRYQLELARISAWLFIGVLALMTFLLTVGLQHPQPLFSYFCYASIIILPLNLLIFAITNLFTVPVATEAAAPADKKVEDKVDSKSDKKDEKDDTDAKKPTSKKSGTSSSLAWIKALRLTQQLLFILSLVAVTGLALVSAHIFFAPPAAAQQQVQQGQ
jgi:hypothetical protein